MTIERRKHSRMPSFLGGRVHMRHLNSTMDCLIRNYSDAGGRIVLSHPVVLPQAFDLHVTSRDQLYRARVIWRNDLHVGVAFEAPEIRDVEPISLEQVRRIRRLEAEKTSLKRRIDDLSGGTLTPAE